MSRITLTEAAKLLKAGKVVAVPTETVYGLAASLSQPEAVDAIYALKKRPLDNPLIIHLGSPEQILAFTSALPPDFAKLARAFWPGALTMVLECEESKIPSRVRAGLPTAAFRLPSHPLTQELIRETGPLVMPSANLSGKPSGTSVRDVEEDFGAAFPVLDGGLCERGIESTVIRFAGRWEMIRLGCLSAEMLGEVLGYLPVVARPSAKPVCPGQMYKHYAPSAKLRLTGHFEAGRVVVGYAGRSYPHSKRVFPLGAIENPAQVMQNLYGVLRDLDREGVAEAYIDMDVPESGLWMTIRERLRRAAD